jgi:hypothetical protein
MLKCYHPDKKERLASYNDSKKNINATGAFIAELGDAVTNVQVLPYHNLGIVKYQRIDEDAVVLEAPVPTDEKVQEVIDIIEAKSKRRKQITASPIPIGASASFNPYPVEVEVGGATIFVLDVDRFEKV